MTFALTHWALIVRGAAPLGVTPHGALESSSPREHADYLRAHREANRILDQLLREQIPERMQRMLPCATGDPKFSEWLAGRDALLAHALNQGFIIGQLTLVQSLEQRWWSGRAEGSVGGTVITFKITGSAPSLAERPAVGQPVLLTRGNGMRKDLPKFYGERPTPARYIPVPHFFLIDPGAP